MTVRPKRDATKNDLRWRRTEKLLLKAFEQELEGTPLDKVKVVAVCETAEVSKAAFYAHYQDIYDLADAFVDAAVQRMLDSLGPATSTTPDGMGFAHRCVQALRSEEQKAFVRIADENRMMPRYLERIYAEVEARVSQDVSHPLAPADRIAGTFALSGAIATVMAHPEVPDDVLEDILSQLMAQTMDALDIPTGQGT
ncbi:MAG: TetR/AcrR family transcriptional regulator [Coriobacteriales bacterium]